MLRPEVLDTLRKWLALTCRQFWNLYLCTTDRNGYSEAAFALAEKYRDFSGLAALCHKEATYAPEENPHSLRIQTYIERFKEDFTTELYRWYIQHGKLGFKHET